MRASRRKAIWIGTKPYPALVFLTRCTPLHRISASVALSCQLNFRTQSKKIKGDFDKLKIIYDSMTQDFLFHIDREGFITNQKCFIITGEHLKFLTVFLNSKTFRVAFRNSFPMLGKDGYELSKIFFQKLEIPMPSKSFEKVCENYICEQNAIAVEDALSDIFKLSEEEKDYILNCPI